MLEFGMTLDSSWILIAFMGGLGLAVGSFLNVCVDRLPTGESVVTRRSACDTCHRRLAPLDLIPVWSFLWLRGRCRYCGGRIPPRALLVELLTGALFAYIGAAYGSDLFPQGMIVLLYVGFLIPVSFIDLERRMILNAMIYPALPVALVAAPWSPAGAGVSAGSALLLALAGGAVSFLPFVVLFLVSPRIMGGGDAKLALLLGIMLGLPLILVALPVAFLTGGVVGLYLLLSRRRDMHDSIPYGPVLAAGAIIALLWGDSLLQAYLRLLIG